MNSKHLARGAKEPGSVARGKVRLYSNRFSPYSQRILLILEAKRLHYEVINIDMERRPDWIFDKSPEGKVPILELDNGETIWESNIIADYLEDKYHQRPMHPRDPLVKAKNQMLLREFANVTTTLLKTLHLSSPNSDDLRIIANGLNLFEKTLRNRNGQFFSGTTRPGMLDYMIWPWCERAEALKALGKDYLFKNNKFPGLMKWCKVMADDQAVKATSLSTERHLNYFQQNRIGYHDYDSLLKI